MSKQLVSIIDVPKHVGEEITIGAWVANKSGKGKLAFLHCVTELPSSKL